MMNKQFKLAKLRESLATCDKYSHLPELQPRRNFCKEILDEVDGVNYELIYRAAAASVTKRDTEIDRLQRAIYNMLPHDEAVAIIDDAPRALQRAVMRDAEATELKQKLDTTRANRDRVIAQTPEPDDKISHAFRTVYAQGAVDQAKKALYMHLQKTSKSRYSHQDIKHRDL